MLKPGGVISLTYENYFSFWEPHYKVRWLPLLPKMIGAFYLKSLGRNPKFLNEAVTYTTFAGVRRSFFRAGFECMRLQSFRDSLHSPLRDGLKGKAVRVIADLSEPTALSMLAAVDYCRRVLRTGVHEVMRKPVNQK